MSTILAKNVLVDKQEIQELVEEYEITRNLDLRNRIVLDCMNLTKKFIFQYNLIKDYEDVLNDSVIVIIDAVENYKKNKGACFFSYLYQCLKRSIWHYTNNASRSTAVTNCYNDGDMQYYHNFYDSELDEEIDRLMRCLKEVGQKYIIEFFKKEKTLVDMSATEKKARTTIHSAIRASCKRMRENAEKNNITKSDLLEIIELIKKSKKRLSISENNS